MRKLAGVDYETFSKADLKTVGLHNYVDDESFTPLMAWIDTEERGHEEYDFIMNPFEEVKFKLRLQELLELDYTLVAHNAGFERLVSRWLDFDAAGRWIDSASYARMAGAGEKLEVASRQLTKTPKLAVGVDLIQLFCVPHPAFDMEVPTATKIQASPELSEKWKVFGEYCGIDAQGGREIVEYVEALFNRFNAPDLAAREDEMELITYRMNQAGWPIDRPLVEFMKNRSWANSYIEKQSFLLDSGNVLNFNSPVQMVKYCEARGVKVKSLNKYVRPVLIAKLKKQLADPKMVAEQPRKNLQEVIRMLECKEEIGGSSLSKLPKILELSGKDDILRDQYIHNGAGQTFRTSGRGVQMQNLKKLGGDVRDMDTLYDYNCEWSNTDMADQLRQVFVSSHKDGELIVGDFSAVESRMLGYEAGEEWKLDAYRKGLDVYKVLVTKFDPSIAYEDVTKEQRPRGKYSELSCGYQASGKALKEFMFRLGFDITLEFAAENVSDWRRANPKIKDLWYEFDAALKDVVRMGDRGKEFYLAYGQKVRIMPFYVDSIQEIHPGAVSLMIQVFNHKEPIVTRVVHGAYFAGENLRYYKPAERLSEGALWTDVNKTASQKASQEQGKPVIVKLNLYGGKVVGIITQSLCRELFFDSMLKLSRMLEEVPNAQMIGQFHDEIVVDWWPGECSKEEVKAMMEEAMSESKLEHFPLVADIKSSYRYIK